MVAETPNRGHFTPTVQTFSVVGGLSVRFVINLSLGGQKKYSKDWPALVAALHHTHTEQKANVDETSPSKLLAPKTP